MTFSGPVATAYAAHRRGYPPPVVDLLVRTLGLPRESSVLDLGCGTGQLTVPLASRYDRVAGADPSADMLALARDAAPDAPVTWLLADDAEVARLLAAGRPPGPATSAPAGVDAVTIAQAVHLLDRPPLFRALAAGMSPRARVAVIANGSPMWLRDLDWSRALRAYLEDRLGTPVRSTCGTDEASRAGFRAELAAAGFGAATGATFDYSEVHSFERVLGNVYSALSPSQLPAGPSFEQGLRAALGPGPYEEDVRVSILVAARGDDPGR